MSTELPIPDFDHLPEGALARRIRSLSEEEDVRRMLEYEGEHANRLAVTLVLERRLSALRAGEATQSAGDRAATQPGHGGAEETPNREMRAS